MRHLELIELIYKHRELIDEIYNGENVQDIPSELVRDVGIFQKVSKKYELSDSYTQFANAMLKRVDANFTYGDYNEEIKLLIKQKVDYLETQDKTILLRIKELAKTLYKKIEQRDILINIRINDIVNDNQLSIERTIKDAKDVDLRISELIDANVENLRVLGNELRGIDDELDELLIDIGLDMLPFIDNIHIYNKRLSDFILRTEKRKLQNSKLASLANKILRESDQEFRALLLSNHQMYNHTLKERKSGNIKHVPNAIELQKSSFLDALRDTFRLKKVQRKAKVNKPYGSSEPIALKAIRLERIEEDIKKDKPQDIYKYILFHPEIEKFKEEELDKSYAFKTYLTVIQDYRDNVVLTEEEFNSDKIKVAKWI